MVEENTPADERLMGRREFAAWLTARGYDMKPSTLANYATQGGGPPFIKFGRRVLYSPSRGVVWVQGRCSGWRTSTSDPGGAPAPAHAA